MEYEPSDENAAAGMALFYNHENHLRVQMVKCEGEKCVQVVSFADGVKKVLKSLFITDESVEFEICAREQKACVYVSIEGKKILLASDISLLTYTTEHAGGFVGCTVGVFATGINGNELDYCDVEWLNMVDLTSVNC